MRCAEYDSPASISQLRNAPYSSSLATSASASSASVWSNASQNSDDTSISAPSSEPESCVKLANPWLSRAKSQPLRVEVVPPELRLNPRRSSSGLTTRTGCPPPLVRQVDRKVNFVDNLVDSAMYIVETIWPTATVFCRSDSKEGGSAVLDLRTFIQETLRRSRSSYSTLQVALYYLILIKPHVPEHDFTMEQPDDSPAIRALQCGRRMFLAALILASKYLQDRNYSSRAWSKISGLGTDEINENEMAFLLAVNWKLHITEKVFRRWTDFVVKYSPQPPPSPSSGLYSTALHERQCEEFKKLVYRLTPELDNLEDLAPCSPASSRSQDFPVVPQRWSERAGSVALWLSEPPPPTPKYLEPAPSLAHTPGRLAPALGLLPTPRFSPQSSGFSTPAVSAVPHLLSRGSSMTMAMAQASSVSAALSQDRWPATMSSSPQPYPTLRRSSLANSISTASSPESMVSDSSRASRSSSISSASSLASAPTAKLDVQARCRYAKQCGERYSMRPAIASVPEDYVQMLTSSPESYTGPVAKDSDLSVETPLARREREMNDSDAARALQELQNQPRLALEKKGLKRSRPHSVDNTLHENVRDMLRAEVSSGNAWSDDLVRTRPGAAAKEGTQVPVPAIRGGGHKRLCCSAEAAQPYGDMHLLHPSMNGFAGPGMWAGILNK